MSARERLVDELTKLVPLDRASRLVDAFAHELAGEIRTEARGYEDLACGSLHDGALRAAGAMSYAADLIDPMKEQ
jgi:hypothetical protein